MRRRRWHPFGPNMGRKTLTGCALVFLGLLAIALGNLWAAVGQLIPQSVSVIVIAGGCLLAGIGLRHAQAKQMTLVQKMIGVLAANAQARRRRQGGTE